MPLKVTDSRHRVNKVQRLSALTEVSSVRDDEVVRRVEEVLREALPRELARHPGLRLLADGVRAYRERLATEFSRVGLSEQQAWWQRIRDDPMIGYPHRKILDYLLGRYDERRGCFLEVTFSALVNGARVGKNRANGYLQVLVQKGLVAIRSDGYRKFVKIRSRVKV